MNLIANLLKLADSYSGATGINLRLLSDRIFQDRRRLENLRSGKADLNTRSFERAMLWFASNWPEAVDWPNDVARPDHDVISDAVVDERSGAAA